MICFVWKWIQLLANIQYTVQLYSQQYKQMNVIVAVTLK